MLSSQVRLTLAFAAATAWVLVLAPGCGQQATPIDENLLDNTSFEQVSNGIPKNWKLNNFRGLPNDPAVQYGVTDSLTYDGSSSFFFKAEANTRRFLLLSQEIRVNDVKRVRVRGRVRAVGVGEGETQYPQAGFALTYYDGRHARFESTRFADDRTEPVMGTTDGWVLVDHTFRLPKNTRYIVFHCVLGMEGEMWFDDVSLVVPGELPWRKHESEHFVHYYLDRDYPEGSMEYQERLLENYASRLGVPLSTFGKINYYFYPDTTLLQDELGFSGVTYVDYVRRDIHSVNPVDNHEIVHLLTDPYGTLPKTLSEGTAFYLMNDLQGEPIQPLAQRLLREGKLPTVPVLLSPRSIDQIDHTLLLAAAASFVGYLVEVGGQQPFLELHRETNVYAPYDAFAKSFEHVYGKRLEDADAAWRRTLDRADFSQVGDDSEPSP